MGLFGRSFGLQWHITNQCDQRCNHCYIWGKGRKTKESYKEEMVLLNQPLKQLKYYKRQELKQ